MGMQVPNCRGPGSALTFIQRSCAPLTLSRAYKVVYSYMRSLTPSSSSMMADAYLPSAPPSRLTGTVQTIVAPEPPPSDVWEKATQILQAYVSQLLKSAAAYFKFIKLTDITSAMNNIVHAIATFRDSVQGALYPDHITLDTHTQELEALLMALAHGLESIHPPNKAPHAQREEMVDKIMDETELALNSLVTHNGIKVEVVTTYLRALKHALVTVGMSISPWMRLNVLTHHVDDINEPECPQFLPALVFSVVAMLVPESWILRPLLNVIGFGPAGPVKGASKPPQRHVRKSPFL